MRASPLTSWPSPKSSIVGWLSRGAYEMTRCWRGPCAMQPLLHIPAVKILPAMVTLPAASTMNVSADLLTPRKSGPPAVKALITAFVDDELVVVAKSAYWGDTTSSAGSQHALSNEAAVPDTKPSVSTLPLPSTMNVNFPPLKPV